MAPNLVTLLGTIGNVIALIVMLAHDTSFAKVLPVWVSLFAAFTIWLYQTLDAVDGKQARRTGTSSPLGQLFDHGCDAITTTMVCALYFQAVLIGQESDLMSMFCFYLSAHVSESFARITAYHNMFRSPC